MADLHRFLLIFTSRQYLHEIPTLFTVKPVLSGHSKEDPKMVFKTDNRLTQDKSIT